VSRSPAARSRPHRTGRRHRTGRAALQAASAAIVLVLLGGCTPEQFQGWWTSQGRAPLSEPHLSRAAAAATAHWQEVARRARFGVDVRPIDAALAARMTPTSWRPGCPVGLADLRYVRVTHLGFDGGERVGELVVHRDAVGVIAGVFRHLWDQRFPIERMQLVDDFGGSDDASVAANNTSAFNCRNAVGGSSWSQHAYGRAIDINPLVNPYVSGSTVIPPAGAAFLDRGNVRTGMIVPGGPAVNGFRFAGWGWGGDWRSTKDYQHFSASGR
jgi:poly-gamma-glutamate synthesis protein (capsule biosynthesis protein)